MRPFTVTPAPDTRHSLNCLSKSNRQHALIRFHLRTLRAMRGGGGVEKGREQNQLPAYRMRYWNTRPSPILRDWESWLPIGNVPKIPTQSGEWVPERSGGYDSYYTSIPIPEWWFAYRPTVWLSIGPDSLHRPSTNRATDDPLGRPNAWLLRAEIERECACMKRKNIRTHTHTTAKQNSKGKRIAHAHS